MILYDVLSYASFLIQMSAKDRFLRKIRSMLHPIILLCTIKSISILLFEEIEKINIKRVTE